MANPMYRQIAEDLREQIESGAIKPDQQLPTELELRDYYVASRNTVRDAIKWLTTLGLVETKLGQGTFVVQKIEPFLTTPTTDPKRPAEGEVVVRTEHGYGEIDRFQKEGQRRHLAVTPPKIEVQKATYDVARQLAVPTDSQVISRHQKRYIDETPWSLQTSLCPIGFVLKGADRLIEASDIPGGTVRYLEDSLGLRQIGYRTWILVRAPDVTEATFFNLPADGRMRVSEIQETAFDQTSSPMRLTVSVFPVDRNQFIVNVGDVPQDPVSLTGRG